MENKRYKPQIDRLFWAIIIPTALLLIGVTVVCTITAPLTLVWMLAIDLFTLYFIISPLFGYVELRESCVFIKFGFFMKREIPYDSIYGTQKIRKWYSDSMLSLKNSMEHVNIKYNRFELVSVSVADNDGFIADLDARRFSRGENSD